MLFDALITTGLTDAMVDYHESVDADQGRIETRRYWLTGAVECLGVKASWANVAGVGMVESQVEVGAEVSFERRYFLTSPGCDAERFAQAVRQHWGIENSLHMSVLRHLALNLIRRESRHKRGIKARRIRAGWDRGYLMQILTG